MKEIDINFKSDRISVLERVLLTSENENEKLEDIKEKKGYWSSTGDVKSSRG